MTLLQSIDQRNPAPECPHTTPTWIGAFRAPQPQPQPSTLGEGRSVRSSLPPVAQGEDDLREEATGLLLLPQTAPAAVGRGRAAVALLQGRARGDLDVVLDEEIGAVNPEVLEVGEGEVRVVEPEQYARQVLPLQQNMIHLQPRNMPILVMDTSHEH